MSITLKCKLDSLDVDRQLVGFNDGLNFGRFSNNSTIVDYTVSLSKAKFIALMKSQYNQIRDDIKADDEAMNESSDFSKVGYCSLTELLDEELSFRDIVKGYLGRILLEKLFSESHKPRYIINSIDAVRVDNDEVILQGKAFERLY